MLGPNPNTDISLRIVWTRHDASNAARGAIRNAGGRDLLRGGVSNGRRQLRRQRRGRVVKRIALGTDTKRSQRQQ